MAAENQDNDDAAYRQYRNVGMSFWRYLFNAHHRRIEDTVKDAEDVPLLQSHVRLPTAPKKNKERGINTTMPGADENTRQYHYQPGPSSSYNAERVLLQEQQLAKKLRKKNRGVRRLEPVSRKKLNFRLAEGEGEPSTSAEPEHGVRAAQSPRGGVDSDIAVESSDSDSTPADIGWERT